MKKKITKIKAQKRKGRFNVYLNGRYAFPISEMVMIKYRIFKGDVITPALEKTLVSADAVSKLYDVAVNFLSHHLRTRHEIVRKLSKRTENSELIKPVIRKLVQLNLINDQNYADCYVRTEVRKQDRGPEIIKKRLMLKRVPPDKIDRALHDFYPRAKQLQNGIAQAKRLKRRYRRESFRRKIQKIKRGLVRAGFSFAAADWMVDACHFKPDVAAQHRIITKRASLAWRRYRNENRFNRRMKTKRYLYRQGFSIDEIDRVLDRINN